MTGGHSTQGVILPSDTGTGIGNDTTIVPVSGTGL